ncbi:MAG TPA: hotdog domain-containing protein [Nitriliruptorales bacterium]
MRPGPARGETATLEIVVTPDMTARVGGREIHPVYGTGALVQHVEEVCRTILEPHLEEGEEGVGYQMDVTHRAPVAVGASVTLTASVAKVGPQELTCEVLARSGNALVARGSFTQRVVDLAEFRQSISPPATVG